MDIGKPLREVEVNPKREETDLPYAPKPEKVPLPQEQPVEVPA